MVAAMVMVMVMAMVIAVVGNRHYYYDGDHRRNGLFLDDTILNRIFDDDSQLIHTIILITRIPSLS